MQAKQNICKNLNGPGAGTASLSRLQDLQGLRSQIDHIDNELAALLTRRLELVFAIGLVKAEHALPVKDNLREKKVLEKVAKITAASAQSRHVVRIFEQILAQSCLAQEANKIVSLKGKR